MELYRGKHYHVSKHKFNGVVWYCVASNVETGVIFISRNFEDAVNRLKEVENNE